MAVLGIANRVFEQLASVFVEILVDHGLSTDAREAVGTISDRRLRREQIVETRARLRRRGQGISGGLVGGESLESAIETRGLTRQGAVGGKATKEASGGSVVDGIAADVQGGAGRIRAEVDDHVRVVLRVGLAIEQGLCFFGGGDGAEARDGGQKAVILGDVEGDEIGVDEFLGKQQHASQGFATGVSGEFAHQDGAARVRPGEAVEALRSHGAGLKAVQGRGRGDGIKGVGKGGA